MLIVSTVHRIEQGSIRPAKWHDEGDRRVFFLDDFSVLVHEELMVLPCNSMSSSPVTIAKSACGVVLLVMEAGTGWPIGDLLGGGARACEGGAGVIYM